MQGDLGAAGLFGDIGDGVVAFAGGLPEHAFVIGGTGGAGAHGHFVRHDERRVETDAELADQLAVFRLVGTDGFQERFGAGLGDGAEVFDHFFAAHADAVVGDGQGALLFIEGQAYAQLAVTGVQLWRGQGAEAQLVGGVRGVGDQLTQENFFVGVQRMDHQMKQLFYFRLEPAGFLTFHTH